MYLNVLRIRKILITFFITFILILTLGYIRTVYLFPQSLMIIEGKEYIYNFNTPVSVSVTADKQGVLQLNGNKIDSSYKINLNSPVIIRSNKIGKVNLKFTLFGQIPLKTVTVNVVPRTLVIPCGQTIGVKIYTMGILVVGTTDITGIDGKQYNPSRESNIKEGDIILSANDKYLEKVSDFADIITNSKGKPIRLTIERHKSIINVEIKPIKSLDDNKYRLGLWVRDSTSGIGTLTFYDPKTMHFGALGHGIVDVDTGSLLKVNKGSILESSVISVKKGKKGDPGELKGVFLNEDFARGRIIENNKFGIYGEIINTNDMPSNLTLMPIALRNEVEEGPAIILSNVRGKKVEAFTIYIQKVLRQNNEDSKSMVIKITDPNLIAQTGGIVQGMSGSPIIQKGKIVGAVTHVFINDSTRGYGVFAELMLQSLNNLNKK